MPAGFIFLDVTMADFITAVTSWFTAAVGWVATVGTTIMGSPILLAFCSLPIVGLGVGLFRRLINVN